MKRIRVWGSRFLSSFRKNRRDRELADEIDSHLQMHIEDNLRSGMRPDEARRDALLKLGGAERTKERYRDRSTFPFVERISQDVRFAARQLRRSPIFAGTAILMLALGICSSVSLFAFVDAALIQPLPYPNPDRLLFVTEGNAAIPNANLSYLDYLDWKRQNTVFQSLDAFNSTGYLLQSGTSSSPIRGAHVTAGFFRTLGIKPLLGRDFHLGEDLAGAPRVAILSYAGWQQLFGGKKDILGQTIRLSDIPYTVVGILPQSFQFAPRGNVPVWTPADPKLPCESRRSCHNVQAIGRLKDGVSVQAALANLKAIATRLETQYPDSNRGQWASAQLLSESIIGKIRPILLTLLGGAILLLLISYVNVASLFLARSEARRREVTIRSSLGASTMRLFVQFGTEASVLIIVAIIAGIVLSGWLAKGFIGLIPEKMLADMPYLQGLGLNTHLVLLAGAIGLGAIFLFSLIPGLHLKFSDMGTGLAEGGRGSAGRAWRRLGSQLVVTELAIAAILLVGAGLLTKSLYRLLTVDLGLNPDRLATLSVSVPRIRYNKNDQLTTLENEVENRVARLPGVKYVGVTSVLPVSFNGNTDWVRIVGHPYNGEHNDINERDVNVDYLRAIQARLQRGRYFTESDNVNHPSVAIVNEAFVRKFFPNEDPIGKRFGDIKLSEGSIRQIVGIVADIREGTLDSEIWPAEYLPFKQSPDSFFSVVVRTEQNDRSMLPVVSAAISQIDPEIGTLDQASMIDRIHDSPSAYLHRSSAWLVGGFAAVALLLSVIGLYGVIAYSVNQRTREIGIRMALGAQRGTVRRLILGEAGRLTFRGLAIGLLGSVVAAIFIRKLLFGVSSWDLPTLGAVALVLAMAAILASYIPAQRAASVDPIDALRVE